MGCVIPAAFSTALERIRLFLEEQPQSLLGSDSQQLEKEHGVHVVELYP